MKIISWNVRGLGNPRTCLAIKKILHPHRPQLIFLCETKLSSRQVNNVCRKLGTENCLAVDSKGKGGGLAMLWSSEITVQITSYSNHHIDAEFRMQMEEAGDAWAYTVILKPTKRSIPGLY